MDQTTVLPAPPAETLPIQFDLFHLFFQAHPVGQAVLIGLLLASVATWAIVVDRWLAISWERRAAGRFERLFWSGKSLAQIEQAINPGRTIPAISALFLSALKEWRLSVDGGAPLNVPTFRERVQSAMEVEGQRRIARLERGLLFLATIGSAGPFIGLFGTVWGIMNAFTSIAQQQNASLAVVAPGIAEALAATALGLVAAIPAVVFYNKFSGDIAGFGARLENFSRELWSTISREIDLNDARLDESRGSFRHGRDEQRVGQPAQ
ncbi:MAG TPA: protein TolQ [Devosia sp.]|jgi:biopolymer transport protein TolQ|uniref:protein TolQ n=1 Tax=Devosia sp. TaxID=1871048 RepID=UPI002DDDA239|nr:protein TolQ [Devosia sp.]HEV2518099.1 protein TolQ [Devosia sp.]